MKKLLTRFCLILSSFTVTGLWSTANGQTLNVRLGEVIYRFPASQAGEMTYTGGTTLTIMGRTFALSEITGMYIDNTAATDTLVSVVYSDTAATVSIPGCVAQYVDASVVGAHVSVAQSDEVSDDNVGEITYALSGESGDGEFYLSGSYKSTVELRGLTLTNTNPEFSGAAIHVQNGKRINISAKRGTVNTLTDAKDGTQKGCLYVKGHAELKGQGTLSINGLAAHALKSGDYMTLRNCTLNILSAAKDGISCNEYFLQQSGAVTIGGIGDDAIQVDLDGDTSTGATTDHEDEDSGNIYLTGGTLTATVTADACKGLKSVGDIVITGGTLDITQTGGIVTTDDDIAYPTSVKADGNVTITGGNVTIRNTAAGGKGISADGSITIDESDTTTVIDITANGVGGVAEVSGGGDDTPAGSYKVYVSLPTSGGGGPFGGGNAWTKLYLYKGDGTLVQQLTATVTKSSGYSNTTFYYYDFKAADSGTYYLKSDNYNSRGTTYAIQSATFTGPATGTDIYYSISSSYTTSGTTRTYKLTNVTNTYGGSSDTSEEDGTGYNAIGIKADSDITVNGGTVTVKNSGEMSKSVKSKATVTVNGGTLTLTPSGAMKVISGDASYSSAVKTVDYVQNGGSLTVNASGAAGRGITATDITTNGGTLRITNSGAGQTGSSDTYTAKGLKADGYTKLNGGDITVSMTGSGGKGIKVNGTYTQGTADGNGPTLTVSTTGSAVSSSSSGGGNPFGGGDMGGSLSGTAKAIKVMNAVTIYGGTTEISTATDGAEGLESKHSIDIRGGKHYFKCYDDCINCSKKETGATGKIYFNGGVTVCYSNGNDAVDSNAGSTGAITIGDGAVFAYTTRGAPEEGIDCDNNSYIQISGTGIAISAGGNQGGGMGGSGSSISGAAQGYYLSTSTISYSANTYYTIASSSGTNLVTYSFPASFSSSLSLFTATGMAKGSTYTIKSSTSAPTDATTAFHGLYIGSTATGQNSVTSFTAQ